MAGRHSNIMVISDRSLETLRLHNTPEGGETFHYELVRPASMEDGLARRAEGAADLVLLDLGHSPVSQAPVLPGICARAPEVPLLVMGESADEAFASAWIRKGAQDYLTSGAADAGHLRRSIHRAIERRGLLSELSCKTKRLQFIESGLKQVIEKSGEGIIVVDLNGIVRFANPVAEELFSRSAGQLVGQPFGFPLVAGETTDIDVVRRGEKPVVAEMRVAESQWEGETVCLASFRDITVRKLAEETLRESKRQIEFILGATKTGLDIIDSRLTLRYVDPEWARAYGDWTGRKCYDYFMGRSEPCPKCGVSKALQTGQTSVTEEMLVKEGNRPVQVTSIPYQDKNSEWLIAEVNVDITERTRLEGQLRLSQKMEAIGQLAGGVAHDFNNLLTGITGFTQLALGKDSLEPRVRADLEQVCKLADRAADLTRQLLAFSRRQSLKPVNLNINTLVENFSKILQRLIGEDHDFCFSPAPDLGTVLVDPGQFEQVLVNLVINARDAMPRGGKLTIETANVNLDNDYADAHTGAKPGPNVMLAVTDTGCGMDEETKKHIFEPFFTTKEVGRGTGLGLATVYGIVKQHGAHIGVYSELGKGTTFKLYLPRMDAQAQNFLKEPPGEEIPRGSETILVVEDEGAVRTIIRRCLEELGYTVLAVEHPEKALLAFSQKKEQIALLLTDVVMPDLSGPELYEKLARENPSLKVLYISGYTDKGAVRGGTLGQNMPFLQKPFHHSHLAKKVREALDRDESRANHKANV